VTCRDIDDLLLTYKPGASVPANLAAHIAGCERCRRLVEAIAQTPPAGVPAAEQLQQIEKRVLADLKPVKPLAAAGVRWLWSLLIVALVVVIGALDLGDAGWHALDALQRLGVFTILGVGVGFLAFSIGQQIVPGSRLGPSPYLLIGAGLGFTTGAVAILFHPHHEATFVATGLVCLRIGIECAAPTALLLWLLLRRGAILKPQLTGATLGTLAGLAGLTVLEIFCPNLNRYHILVWHLGAVLTSLAAGLAIGTLAEYSDRRR